MNIFKKADYLYILIVSAIYVLIFSTTTSPLYYKPLSIDSSAFQLIGKYWSEGYLPYVDLWDLKGPIIFWINAIGYWMTGTAFGVLILQVLFMTAFGLMALRMLGLEYDAKWAKLLWLVILMGGVILYSGGNTVEEYALPFLMGCFYCFYKWGKLVTQDKTVAYHKPIWAFLYGITFAFCVLTRVTNAVGLCCGILIVLIYLIYYHAWDNILKNAFAFVLGCLLLIIPFSVYFMSKGAFDEFLYGTILYGVKYYENSDFNFVALSMKGKAYMLFVWFVYALLFVVGFIKLFFYKKQIVVGFLWLSIAISTFLWIMSSNGYVHYSIIALPYLCISMCEYKQIGEDLSNRFFTVWKLVAVLVVMVFMTQCAYFIHKNWGIMRGLTPNENIVAYDEILENVPKEEWNSLMAYNVYTDFYLYNDIKPCYRFFGFQDSEVWRNPEFRELLREPFLSCKAKWIVVDGYAFNIQDILTEHYERVYTSDVLPKYILYKLRQ